MIFSVPPIRPNPPVSEKCVQLSTYNFFGVRFFLSLAQQPNSGLDLLIFELSESHIIGHSHPVGLL